MSRQADAAAAFIDDAIDSSGCSYRRRMELLAGMDAIPRQPLPPPVQVASVAQHSSALAPAGTTVAAPRLSWWLRTPRLACALGLRWSLSTANLTAPATGQ